MAVVPIIMPLYRGPEALFMSNLPNWFCWLPYALDGFWRPAIDWGTGDKPIPREEPCGFPWKVVVEVVVPPDGYDPEFVPAPPKLVGPLSY